jgi:hypothetical protein
MSIPGRNSTAATLVRTGFVVVLMPVNVSGFRPVLACMWHGSVEAHCRGGPTGDHAQPMPCLGANPQELSDFDVPAYVAGRLWCPARGVFPASIRVGIVTTSRRRIS